MRPKGFTLIEKEWHQVIINFLETILNMKVKPALIYDRSQFSKHTRRSGLTGNQVWAECSVEHGLIWISKDLASQPYVHTLNVLVHECLHIKYPNWSETKVRKEADRVVPIIDDKDHKKKSFDQIHKKS